MLLSVENTYEAVLFIEKMLNKMNWGFPTDGDKWQLLSWLESPNIENNIK